MKKTILIVITSFLISSAYCQTKIGIDSVNAHVGEKVTVCSKVYGTKALVPYTLEHTVTFSPTCAFTESIPIFVWQ